MILSWIYSSQCLHDRPGGNNVGEKMEWKKKLGQMGRNAVVLVNDKQMIYDFILNIFIFMAYNEFCFISFVVAEAPS